MADIKIVKTLWEKYGYRIFALLARIGIVLIYLSEISYPVKESKEELSSEQYRLQLEKSLAEILSQIKGAGEVKLMITLESGEENVYAFQEKSDTDQKMSDPGRHTRNQQRTSYENEIVFTDGNGERHPVLEKIIRPSVQGVVVVCQGADDIRVTSDITNAVSVVLNIPTNRVCVIKMQ